VNWEAIQAITEMLGLIAVIASLLYIGTQTKQSNEQATAASEVEWINAWNQILNSWVSDERTTVTLQKGFASFNDLTNTEKALFHMRIGAMVNHWMLAQKLDARDLISKDLAEESTKVLLSTLTTQGGYEFIEHDWKLFPGGAELMELVNRSKGEMPTLTEILPWWGKE
jgi:hypothetical protein